MSIAVAGKKLIYLYRLLEQQATADGTRLAFVTENERSVSKDADSTATKDGTIRTPSNAEVEITTTTILAKGDTMIDALEDAMIHDKIVEIWEANLEEPHPTQANKFKGKYFQGYVTECNTTSSAEDMVEKSLTFGVNGTGAEGWVTVTPSQQEDANYVFTDTPATSPVPDVHLNKGNISIPVGGTYTLTASTTPAGATVTWTSSTPAKATVLDGIVTGVEIGRAHV